MNVVDFSTKNIRKPFPDDLPVLLRAFADRVENGSVTEMVLVWVENDSYCFAWPSNLHDSLVLTTIAQHEAINRMKRG